MNLADDLLKGARAASVYTGLPERTIYHAVESGQLPVTRLGKTLIFRKSVLNHALGGMAHA